MLGRFAGVMVIGHIGSYPGSGYLVRHRRTYSLQRVEWPRLNSEALFTVLFSRITRIGRDTQQARREESRRPRHACFRNVLDQRGDGLSIGRAIVRAIEELQRERRPDETRGSPLPGVRHGGWRRGCAAGAARISWRRRRGVYWGCGRGNAEAGAPAAIAGCAVDVESAARKRSGSFRIALSPICRTVTGQAVCTIRRGKPDEEGGSVAAAKKCRGAHRSEDSKAT